MKLIAAVVFTIYLISGCVQKTHTKTVVYILDTDQPSEIKTAGIRGRDTPLNWNNDSTMVMQNDSTFKVIITYNTGYKYTEAKFVVNDKIELAGGDNRKIFFSPADTTIYQAIFDKPKE